jgi:hypothetical protein
MMIAPIKVCPKLVQTKDQKFDFMCWDQNEEFLLVASLHDHHFDQGCSISSGRLGHVT